MRYDGPELRERLAAQYVLGTLPPRARRRLERELSENATVAAAVAAWTERFAPIDNATPDEAPPERVWRAVERRLGRAAPAARPGRRGLGALAFWRGAALTAAAACAALAFYVATSPIPGAPRVFAVLADTTGQPSWIALSARQGEVAVSSIGSAAPDTGHSFQLWGIAGGPPKPLGLLQGNTDKPLTLSAAALPDAGGVLAISLEPQGGSPTGLPTGPVLFQGKVLAPAAP